MIPSPHQSGSCSRWRTYSVVGIINDGISASRWPGILQRTFEFLSTELVGCRRQNRNNGGGGNELGAAVRTDGKEIGQRRWDDRLMGMGTSVRPAVRRPQKKLGPAIGRPQRGTIN